MNILEKIKSVLGDDSVKLGFQPDAPDAVTTLYEYSGQPPDHSFGATDEVYGVQVRARAASAAEAFELAQTALGVLNRYHDAEISVLQSTPVLDIGRDSKLRQEYTVNFTVRRY
ncbi:MAG: minor capsid protein [Oscillospiraceae bacterium]